MNQKRGHFNNSRFFYNPLTQQTSFTRMGKDDLYFQSKYEFQVYRTILKCVKREFLTLQYPLEIKPKTELFKPIYWQVDFAVRPRLSLPDGIVRDLLFPELFIESKGLATREFKRDIQYLEWQQPKAYNSLVLVSENTLDFEGVPCVKLGELEKYLKNRLH